MTVHSSLPRLAVRDKRGLLARLRAEFAIDWHGFHGAAHWARVARNGLLLCGLEGGNPRVVMLFALLHDSQRRDEYRDRNHGQRAAAFVAEIAGEHLLLGRDELARLADACAGHSEGLLSRDPTIAACWDADRLDLGRVGTEPRPALLSLRSARHPDFLRAAHRRALAWRAPAPT